MWPLRKLFEYTSSFSFLKRKKTKTLKKDNIPEMSHQKQNEMYLMLQSKGSFSSRVTTIQKTGMCIEKEENGQNHLFWWYLGHRMT